MTLCKRSLAAGVALGLVATAAMAATLPAPAYSTVTVNGGVIAGVAATADAQAGTATNLVITPATLRTGTAAQLSGLPTAMPTTVGALWNNGGVLSVVQP